MLRARGELLRGGHDDARLVILMNPANKFGFGKVQWEDLVQLLQERHQWDHFSKCLRESDVFQFCSAERDLGFQTADPMYGAGGVHDYVSRVREDIICVLGICFCSALCKACVNVALEAS